MMSLRARTAALGACGLLAAAACTRASSGSPALAPAPAPAPAAVQELCAGQRHTCARRNAAVACWGDNTFHQIAASADPQFDTPRIVRELPAATALRCGAFETCVLTADGGVHCLGGPARAEALNLGKPARDVVLGANGGCALLRDGTTSCWDRPPAEATSAGPTRFPRAAAEVTAPFAGDPKALEAAAPPGATRVAFGDGHACAIVRGAVQCWGAASYGQLGAGESFLHPKPVRVPDVSSAIHLDASTVQACAFQAGGEMSGKVTCWGQLVDERGRLEPQFKPQSFELPPNTNSIHASAPASSGGRAQPLCARSVREWHCRSARGWVPGQAPDDTAAILAGAKVQQRSRDGRCGVNLAGQLICVPLLPVGTTRARNVAPVVIDGPSRFVGVASGLLDGGRSVVCGRTEDRRVGCFHLDAAGAATRADSPSIAALTNIEQLVAGGQGDESVACARTKGGTVSCWGDGRYGQLGPTPPGGRLVAVSIGGLPVATEIAVGGTFACAQTGARDVFCWGSNRDGAVPDGLPRTRLTPVAVAWPSETSPPFDTAPHGP